MMEQYIPLISNVGFPIAIALYVLTRLEKTLNKNTEVIRELCIQLNIKEMKGGRLK